MWGELGLEGEDIMKARHAERPTTAQPIGFFLLLFATSLAVPAVRGGDPAIQAERMAVALLGFEDKTEGPKDTPWLEDFDSLIGEKLGPLKSIRLVHRGHGFRELKLKEGGPISTDQARKIGELVEARRVIWGSYLRKGAEWKATARVLKTASGEISADFEAASEDLFEVGDRITEKVLAELQVQPTLEEKVKLKRRPTSSIVAYEWYSMACSEQLRVPMPEQESWIRKALSADAKFVEAHLALAAVLGSQGKLESVAEEAHRALEIDPDNARAHQVLGVHSLFQGKLAEAEKEFREALRLDPDDSTTWTRLGECQLYEKKVVEAVGSWQTALRLDPMNAGILAHLGDAHALKGDRDRALEELMEAERLGSDDVDAQQLLTKAYDELHDTPDSVAHGEKFIRLARKRGLNSKVVDSFEELVRKMTATLTPREVAAVMPEVHSGSALDEAFHDRLSEAELKLVTNPLASSPEMKEWAERLIANEKDDLGKARRLFDEVDRHLAARAIGPLSAQEVFASWNDPDAPFVCQEQARLYVALARDAGLKAFYVNVQEDWEGHQVLHSCAAVFIDGKAFLVDPGYHWFGVPHRRFAVRDDLQAIADYLNQQEDVASNRVAVKLDPDSAIGWFNLACHLMAAGALNEAGQALEMGLRLDSESAIAHLTQGLLAARQEKWVEAAAWLGRAVELAPRIGASRLAHAWVLESQGFHLEARDAYREALPVLFGVGDRATARRAISQLDEKLAQRGAIHTAALQGDLEKVRSLLKADPGLVNSADESGLNPLHYAAMTGEIAVVDLLLAENAPINGSFRLKASPLWFAALGGKKEVLEALLDHGAKVDVVGVDGKTALSVAALLGREEIVEVLLARDASCNSHDSRGATPLHLVGGDVTIDPDGIRRSLLKGLNVPPREWPVGRGHRAIAERLLAAGARIDARDDYGMTPLNRAARSGNFAVVEVLVGHEADVIIKDSSGFTPLHSAAERGHQAVVELLLARRANLEARTKDGCTPLHCAAQAGHLEVVNTLLEHGAEVDAPTTNRATPLHGAANCGETEVVEALLAHGADVHLKTTSGLTPLHFAANRMNAKEVAAMIPEPTEQAAYLLTLNDRNKRHRAIAESLLRRQADVDARDLQGRTPLFIAASTGQEDVARLLVAGKADVNARGEKGRSPLCTAAMAGHKNVVELLLASGADVTAADEEGFAPLHAAADHGQPDIVELLLAHGVDANTSVKEKDGSRTALHLAAQGHRGAPDMLGNADFRAVASKLIGGGADVAAPAHHRATPLHLAALNGQVDVAEVLLASKADINATDDMRQTPLHLAVGGGQMAAVQFLLAHGADDRVKDSARITPLAAAEARGHKEIAALLRARLKPVTGPGPGSSKGWKVEEVPLGPMDAVVTSPAFSRDGLHLAYVSSRGPRRCVVLDGQAGALYYEIQTPVFSPDGKRVAYAAQKSANYVVVVDGREGAGYDGLASPVFSPDSKRVAHLALKGNRSLVVVDGQESAGFDGILTGTPIFSPDGRRVAYGAREGAKWSVVVDGQAGAEYDGIFLGHPVFSPDGRHLAYGAKEGVGAVMVVDGREVAKFDGILDGTAFSPDGEHAAYRVKVGNNWSVAVDGLAGPAYDGIGTPMFSSDGKRLTYAAMKGQKWLAVVDGQENAAYDAISMGSPLFSADGRRVAYAANLDGKAFVVVDGQEGTKYQAILKGSPFFSPDGKHVVYWAQKGAKKLLVIDGQEGPEHDEIINGSLVVSRDGKRIAYMAMKGARQFVVVDGQAGAEWENIIRDSLSFSADCKHVAYGAVKALKVSVVIDGREGPWYDVMIQNGPTFHPDGSLEYLAIKENTLYRVQQVQRGSR